MYLLKSFNNTIDYWISELESYDDQSLSGKTSPGSWSIGQLYNHLITDSKYYITQIKICVDTNLHCEQETSAEAKEIFQNNSLSDKAIKGASDHSFMPDVDDAGYLRSELFKIKLQMNTLYDIISKTPFHGKTEHPGLGYFSAREWFHFADIHFRHHLKQKQRIDNFLNYSDF